jgi:hypothetical protein
MITAILSLLGSSAFGSIIGGIFAFLNKKSDLDVKRMELDHEKDRWAHDLVSRDKDIEYAKTEAQGRHDVAVVEGDASIETARMNAIAQSQAADTLDANTLKAAGKYRWMLVVGGAMRACIRPVLTVIIAGASIYLNWLLIGRLVEAWPTLSQAQQYDMGMQAFAWVTGQASAVIGYWFVSRGSGK